MKLAGNAEGRTADIVYNSSVRPANGKKWFLPICCFLTCVICIILAGLAYSVIAGLPVLREIVAGYDYLHDKVETVYEVPDESLDENDKEADVEHIEVTTELPAEVLLDVPAYSQQALGLFTGCEIVSVAMMFNYQIQADVYELADEMPRADDPWEGYRGDPYSFSGFTIMPAALLGMVEEYMGGALDMTGCEPEDLRAQLALGRPVVIWVQGMHGFNVHSVCVVGYDQGGFYVNDPWTGEKNLYMEDDIFFTYWNENIVDKVTWEEYPERMAISY